MPDDKLHTQDSGTSAILVEIDSDSANRRLDNFLISKLRKVPHSRVYNLIRTGQVRVNSGRCKPNRRLELGDSVRIPPVLNPVKDLPVKPNPAVSAATHSIVYEDDDIIVIDKPSGIAVHSGTRHQVGLIEAMRMERADLPNVELAHRLDKDTSGLLVLAKNKRILRHLHAQWRRDGCNVSLKKRYQALLVGYWEGNTRNIESHSQNSQNPSRAKQTKSVAFSRFSPIQKFTSYTLVDIELHTGKMHQARIHAQQIGHPIAGDRKFGDKESNAKLKHYGLRRMFLHACEITISHPTTDNVVTFESALPAELCAVLNRFNLPISDS